MVKISIDLTPYLVIVLKKILDAALITADYKLEGVS